MDKLIILTGTAYGWDMADCVQLNERTTLKRALEFIPRRNWDEARDAVANGRVYSHHWEARGGSSYVTIAAE